MIESYSADAVRYWASSTGFGKDSVINEEKIKAGAKLVTKLYNVARFCAPFIQFNPKDTDVPPLSAADRWILGKMHRCIKNVTEYLNSYDYAAAKNEVELFFWHDLTDNYIEMAKLRIYDQATDVNVGPAYTLAIVLLNVIKLLAPFTPYISEKVYLLLYTEHYGDPSIHTASWPEVDAAWLTGPDSELGENLVDVATRVRRYKSDHALSLGYKLSKLRIFAVDSELLEYLQSAKRDLMSVTRALELDFSLIPRDELVNSEKIKINVEI
jgi:valyl-tRNA synthetase